jgi:hypothetical protein
MRAGIVSYMVLHRLAEQRARLLMVRSSSLGPEGILLASSFRHSEELIWQRCQLSAAPHMRPPARNSSEYRAR